MLRLFELNVTDGGGETRGERGLEAQVELHASSRPLGREYGRLGGTEEQEGEF